MGVVGLWRGICLAPARPPLRRRLCRFASKYARQRQIGDFVFLQQVEEASRRSEMIRQRRLPEALRPGRVYRAKWCRLVDLEWQAEEAAYEERKAWPLAKLVREGFTLAQLSARDATFVERRRHDANDAYGPTLHFRARVEGQHRTRLPETHGFQTGDLVAVSGGCEVREGKVLAVTSTSVIVNANAKWNAFDGDSEDDGDGTARKPRQARKRPQYRLDRVANTVAHDRTLAGIESWCEEADTMVSVGALVFLDDGAEGVVTARCEVSGIVSVMTAHGATALPNLEESVFSSSDLSKGESLRLDDGRRGTVIAIGGGGWVSVETADGGEIKRRKPFTRIYRRASFGTYGDAPQLRHLIIGSALLADHCAPRASAEECAAGERTAPERAPSSATTDAGLDAAQRDAVALSLRGPLSLIQGPPGTGKTATACVLLAIAASKNATQSPLLATADSNVACDQLLTGLLERGVVALRFGSCGAGASDQMRAATVGAVVQAHPRQLEVAELRSKAAALKEKMTREKPGRDTTARLTELREIKAKIKSVETEIFEAVLTNPECAVLCATLVGCGSPQLASRTFPFVLLDEASQATEPRCAIALAKARGPVVLVGDQQQLPPTCVSRDAEREGLGTSLFARLISEGRVAETMLTTQYRMSPLIRAFPSEAFYDDNLIDAPVAALRDSLLKPVFAHAVAFIDIADGVEARAGTSFKNEAEAEVALAIVTWLRATLGPDASVGLISPYKGQVRVLQAALRAYERLHAHGPGPAARGVEAKTVDGFQGSEKDCIILSCVRANDRDAVGFLNDHRRLNVAITRARHNVIILGNRRTLRGDALWARYLDFIDARGLQVQLSDVLDQISS